MQEFEKLGAFYLGRMFDPDKRETSDELILYDAKDLTTHGMIVGMTGSGKTGLGVTLIEEAAIDGIPVLAIDPKGDLANLCLAFPDMSPADFRPWVDESEAARKAMSPDAFAERTAEIWKKGLAQWGQGPDRVRKFVDAAEVAVYTPGNSAGRPLQVLRSFSAPPPELRGDTAALRDRVLSAVSGLLGLMGIDADPIQSREHILLSNILDAAWREGRDLDLPALIQAIQKPSFERVGVFDLESFYPAKERFGLAMSLNNLLASPGFSAWMEGEPLDIQRLLYTPEGRPRVTILYIAHLSDAERMFFVTLLLNEVLAWMRAQAGTGSLRALLYMDEIYGYFPPTANPPSKTPMLTLLKQARAFGLGVVLSTQNPVDLDYKGLSNCGTWFIGRLQTERDKARVIEGLEGAAGGERFDRRETETMLASLGDRVFLMRNVHEDQPALFQTRWALSYLRGPLTLPQIRGLAASGAAATTPATPFPSPLAEATPPAAQAAPPPAAKPNVPAEVAEFFLRAANPTASILYRPVAIGVSKLHFVDAKTKMDTWQPYTHLAPFSTDGRRVEWDQASPYGDIQSELDRKPLSDSRFANLPAGAGNAKGYTEAEKTLTGFLYQTVTLDLCSYPPLKLTSQPGETEGDFTARLSQALREQRDVEVEKLRAKYAPKLRTLEDRLRRAQQKVEREKSQYGQQKLSTVISFGATLLGAFMGRKVASVGTVGRAATTMRSASRIGREKEDVEQAGQGVAAIEQAVQDLNAELERETGALSKTFNPDEITIVHARLRPRKSDISVERVGLAWVPWKQSADGIMERA